MKKNRGAGNRGGRGMAGSGKRADQKKPSILKKYGPKYFGKHGFNRPQSKVKKPKIINLNEIDKNAEKKGTDYIFDASKFDKVLGTGKLTKKIKITSKSFSKSALKKIEDTGGEAITC
jgi:large subunit ribosomal protein L15